MNGADLRSRAWARMRVDVCLGARLDHERDALVAVEPSERGERAALDLDHRDAQRRGVDRERVEGRAALGHDQQAERFTTCRECLLDRDACRR